MITICRDNRQNSLIRELLSLIIQTLRSTMASFLTKASPEFINECINHHNDYRQRHESPPLTEDEKLTKLAQEWAEILAKNNVMKHRANNPYGENIYYSYNSDPNWKLEPLDPVKNWYEEISFYKFGESRPKNSSAVGHFTQLVWKDSKKVGVGLASSKKGHVYVVCNYDPPGNMIGDYEKNVLPAKKSDQEIEEERIERARIKEERDEIRKKRGDEITLTPSEEKIGIKFVQPNIKVIESMDRLIAVPSEKIRVWCCWLLMMGDEIHEWRHWLLSHINLILRMSEIIRKIENTGEQPKSSKRKSIQDSKKRKLTTSTPIKKKKPSDAGRQNTIEKLEKNSQLEREEVSVDNKTPEDSSESKKLTSDTELTPDASEAVKEGEEEIDAGGEETAKQIERENRAETQEKEGEEEIDAGGEETTDQIESENAVETQEKEGGKNEKEENAWPIGVAWTPSETDKKEEGERKNLEEVKIIPIPENEEEMLKLIMDVRHKATIYRSYYKHWIETGNRARNEILDRDVMKTEEVYTHEEIPYFFYLKCDPDVEIGVEHDDEEILLPDTTRERISSNYVHLYFNLDDKPGKGGKPWI